MCGRFVTIIPYEELKQIFDLIESYTRIEPRYNVAPTQHVAVVRIRGVHNVLTPMSWGLITSWSKDASIRLVIEHSFIMAENEKLSVTASIGATMAVSIDTAESVVNRADTLMYESKTAGRNKVTISG